MARGNKDVLVAVGVVLLVVTLCQAQLKCKNDKGGNVDWWTALKFPDGRKYAYGDSSASTLKTSSNTFSTRSASALNATLSQLFPSPASTTYFFYNDQPPTTTREIMGDDAHAKGVLAVDDKGTGFWLVHSTPLFPKGPSKTSKFAYMEDSQVENGQSFLCVSFSTWNAFQNIGAHLLTLRPDIYDSKITTKAKTSAPNLNTLFTGGYTKVSAISDKTLNTAGGAKFKAIAKSGYFPRGYDLWDEVVAPKLRVNLFVQTWRNGAGDPLVNNCTASYKVNNVEKMNLLGVSWKAGSDHSKWAVSASTSSNWVCIGDVNRMASQGVRGGGTLCIQNTNLAKSIRSAVTVTKCT